MFRRQNNRQGQNIQNNRDPRNIFNDEQEPGGIGNEALAENIAGGLINLISNESNNEAMENDVPREIIEDGLAHYYQNDLTNDKLNKFPRDIRNDRLEHYYQNDLNNYEIKPSKKSRRRKEAQKNLPLIPVDEDPINIPDINTDEPKKVRPGGMTEKELPDEDDKLILEKLPEIIEDKVEEISGLDASLSKKVPVRGRIRREKRPLPKSPPKRVVRQRLPLPKERKTSRRSINPWYRSRAGIMLPKEFLPKSSPRGKSRDLVQKF